MPVLGVDCSRWQLPPLPWAAWRDQAPVAVIQFTHGTNPEAYADNHLAGAVAAGYEHIGAYHWLTPGRGAEQAELFLMSLNGYITFSALDVEQAGVTAQDVLDWVAAYEGPHARPLYLYGNNALAAIVAAHPTLARYPVWWANYPLGKVQISAPPVGRHASAPPSLHVAGWQFTGTGRLAPYARNIDLSMWYETPGGTMAKMKPGTLYGIHAESSSQAVPLMRKFQAAGVQVAAILAHENPGLAVDAKAINPNILTIARWRNPNDRWEGGQDVFSWTDAERLDFAKRSIQLIFERTNDTEYAACDYFCPGLNEWDPPELNSDGWRAEAEALKALCQEATNRSPEMTAKGLHPIRLAIPGFNAGTPEWNEMQVMAATGLFDLMKARGDILILHEGVWFDQPIDAGFGDIIPGAPSVPPNAGSLCGRFNYLYSLGVQVPFVVTEWYDGNRRETDPATRLAAIKWYDRLVRRNPWCRGFCPFELTDDPNSTWRGVDFTPTFQSDAMLADMVAEKDKPNPTENNDMPNISDTDYAGLVAANAAVTAILNKYTVPWWLVPAVPFVVVARSLPLTTYNLDHTAHDVRPYASYDLNVTARTADGWLMVAPALLVRAADVKLKGA